MAKSAGSLTICKWLLKMSASEAAELLGDLLDERLQLGRRLRDGPVEALDLSGDLAGIVEWLRDRGAEHRLHAVGDPDHDSRTDTDSLTHDEPVYVNKAESNQSRASCSPRQVG